jgi:uncharacterized protein (DUF362 family)
MQLRQGEPGNTTSARAAVQTVPFVSYEASVPEALEAVQAAPVLAAQKKIMLKPNLVNASPPPITLPVECCEAAIAYVRQHAPDAELMVAEGCGDSKLDTDAVFEKLGYTEMARRLDVPLVDLNTLPTTRLARDDCEVFPTFHVPSLALECFIISLPVLKAHSLATITGTMKNMMGLAPPAHYQQGRQWKKSAFHAQMHQAIVELNRYCPPDLTLLDARVGLAEYHLGGAECDPPANKLLVGFDAREVDRAAAELLGFDWRKIPHLA